MRAVEDGALTVDHASKAAIFDALAEVAVALASGRRAEIIDLLAQGERSVEEVAREIDQSTANASHHLRVLARAGLVRQRRDGTRIYYRLAGDEVEELWAVLRRVAVSVRSDMDDLAEAYLGDGGDVEMLDRAELAKRLATGEVTVLDVRPVVEYRAGHIAGARSVPLSELAAHAAELPCGLPVVAYCRGPYCVFARAAVRALRRRGVDAVCLEDGFPEWRRSGLPVAIGDEPGRPPTGSPSRRLESLRPPTN